MVGVASPLHRVPGAVKFYGGFAAGLVVSGLVLVLVLAPVSLAVNAVPGEWRTAFLAGAALAFGLLDLLGRTPHLSRQVPQRFALQGLPMGSLGLVYGADVGLLVTTIKVTSLLWVAIVGSVLTGSATVVLATVMTAALVQATAVVLLSALDQRSLTDLRFWGRKAGRWTRSAQLLGGLTAVLLAAVTITGVA